MDKTYVVLASNAYSGSTLLSFLLGAHPEIATVSDASGSRREGKMDEYLCSCRRRMIDCPFWGDVRAGMLARGFADFDLGNFRLGFDYAGRSRRTRLLTGAFPSPRLEGLRDAIVGVWPAHAGRMHAIAERNAAFASVVLDVAGKRVFLDASKEKMRPLHLYRTLPMEVRVIHLVRDVRGVVASTMRRGKWAGLTVEGAARKWRDTNEVILRNLRALPPDAWTTVRYEDICRSPDESLSRLAAFCGVNATVRIADFRAEQHLLGNPMRLEGSSEIRLDERWRSALDAEDLARIDRVAGRLLRRFDAEAHVEPVAGGVRIA